MKKELPIAIEDNVVKTECWTFERLSIIQTSKYAKDWIASHFELYMDDLYKTHFGYPNKIFRANYYDDILTCKKTNILEIKSNQIINLIKKNIDNNHYVYLTTFWEAIDSEKVFIHGMMVYGYDDKKRSLLVPLVKNRIWGADYCPYKSIESSHDEVKKYFQSENRRINFATKFHYPFLTYKLRYDYNTSHCAYLALDKIKNELNGKEFITVNHQNENLKYSSSKFYTGIACIKGLKKLIEIYISEVEHEGIYDLTNTLNQMYEHRHIIVLTMKYIQEAWEIGDKQIDKYIENYQLRCLCFSDWYHMSIKYEITKDKMLLKDILIDIEKAEFEEMKILNNFHEICLKWYKNNNLY